jgi:hypothetical protein
MDVTPLSKHRSRAGTSELCRSHDALLRTLDEAGEFLQHAIGVPRDKGHEERRSRGEFFSLTSRLMLFVVTSIRI